MSPDSEIRPLPAAYHLSSDILHRLGNYARERKIEPCEVLKSAVIRHISRRRCSICGAENPPDARFCCICSNALDESLRFELKKAEIHSVIDTAERMSDPEHIFKRKPDRLLDVYERELKKERREREKERLRFTRDVWVMKLKNRLEPVRCWCAVKYWCFKRCRK